MKRLRIKVTGDVQGVFYRDNAKLEAEKLGLKGWAQNEPDGSVSMVIEGNEEAIESFLMWTKQGSPMAEVDNLETAEEPAKDEFNDFQVK